MFRDIVKVFSPFVLSLILLVLVIDRLYWRDCTIYREKTGRETKWIFLNECYVKTKYGWFTREEYRARITAGDGLGASDAE